MAIAKGAFVRLRTLPAAGRPAAARQSHCLAAAMFLSASIPESCISYIAPALDRQVAHPVHEIPAGILATGERQAARQSHGAFEPAHRHVVLANQGRVARARGLDKTEAIGPHQARHAFQRRRASR